jgi:hypothetical protein
VGFLFSGKEFFEEFAAAKSFEMWSSQAASSKMVLQRIREDEMKAKGTSHDHLDEVARHASGDR